MQAACHQAAKDIPGIPTGAAACSLVYLIGIKILRKGEEAKQEPSQEGATASRGSSSWWCGVV